MEALGVRRSVRAELLAAVAVLALSCSPSEPPEPTEPAEDVGAYVNPDDPLPRLRYFADGLVSINDQCPVRRTKLSPGVAPIYVNGRPLGFC